MPLPHPEFAEMWRRGHPVPSVTHLDAAACCRQSLGVLAATSRYTRTEGEVGGYEAEARAQDALERGRADLAGLLRVPADGVAFTTSASGALATLLACWPLGPGDTVACLPDEYGPALAAFARLGLRVEPLPVDGDGRLDVDALGTSVGRRPPAFVHLAHIASHRGTVQPLAGAAAVCGEHGVPLVVDAAQSLGHVPVGDAVAGAGEYAVYSTSRKWLAGPRGVGVLALSPAAAGRLAPGARRLNLAHRTADAPTARLLEPAEGHVAGRIGLCHAVAEYVASEQQRVAERLAAIGRLTRRLLDGAGGWRVVERVEEPSAITTLRPPAGADVRAERERLLHAGFLVSAIPPERAPGDPLLPVLRVSPHVDVAADDIARLAHTLAKGNG